MSKRSEIRFSKAQVEYLDKLFPEVVLPSTATTEQVHQYFGSRRVVKCVQERIQYGNDSTLP